MQTSQTKVGRGSGHKISTPPSKPLVVEREFNVGVEKLFAAFTTSEALKNWWWPKDLYTDRVDIDFREGGRYFINMKGFDQGGGGMTGEFEEIVANKRIVMTDQFADKKGNVISAKEADMPGVWPEVIYITFDFESLPAGKSRFTLLQQGVPKELHKDCIQGWSESFDKLERYLTGEGS